MIIFDLQRDESFVGFLIFLYDQARNTLYIEQSDRETVLLGSDYFLVQQGQVMFGDKRLRLMILQ